MAFLVRKKSVVFVALSGGVDSSVAAYLLKKRGYYVVGVHMRCYNVDGCAERDAEDARRAAEQLSIPFYIFDFEEEYKEKVVSYMVEGYRAGITPNPDVMCNKEIKFGLFYDKARAFGADFIATGHYVRLRVKNQELSSGGGSATGGRIKGGGRKTVFSLFTAKDNNKDQTYFLWTLNQEKLRRCLFPIGHYLKSEIRSIARCAGLITAEKKDSQGVCFLGQISVEDFLSRYIPREQGDVRTSDGLLVGRHSGASFYTIGQRHGLSLGLKNRVLGVRGTQKTPAHYVVSKDVVSNTVTVADGRDNSLLFSREIKLSGVNFILSDRLSVLSVRVRARIRYRQALADAVLCFREGACLLVFAERQKYVARGQSAVFYDKNGRMIGGGIIEQAC